MGSGNRVLESRDPSLEKGRSGAEKELIADWGRKS